MYTIWKKGYYSEVIDWFGRLCSLNYLLSHSHGLRVFYDACKHVALLALTLIAATPSLADMQPIDGSVQL